MEIDTGPPPFIVRDPPSIGRIRGLLRGIIQTRRAGLSIPIIGLPLTRNSGDVADRDARVNRPVLTRYVMLPGMKQRISVPDEPCIGQTMARPTRFGTVMTASSGTSSHAPSSRTL